MPDKSATPAVPPPTGVSPPSTPRDTLHAIDQAFLHDQLQALMASPALSRSGSSAESSVAKEEDPEATRDTEPSIATSLLRVALGRRPA